jgi:hypothetical protein
MLLGNTIIFQSGAFPVPPIHSFLARQRFSPTDACSIPSLVKRVNSWRGGRLHTVRTVVNVTVFVAFAGTALRKEQVL